MPERNADFHDFLITVLVSLEPWRKQKERSSEDERL
jgi:hypothetical protein